MFSSKDDTATTPYLVTTCSEGASPPVPSPSSGAVTVRLNGRSTVPWIPLAEPLTSTPVVEPKVASAPAEMVNETLPPVATVLAEVTPVGRPITSSVTAPVKPPDLLSSTVTSTEPPRSTDALVGETAMLKEAVVPGPPPHALSANATPSLEANSYARPDTRLTTTFRTALHALQGD